MSQALNFMRRMPDNYDILGKYVGMDLRSLSSGTCMRMLKREVRQSVGCLAELDDLNSLATCITQFS